MSTYYKVVSQLDYTFKRVETYTMPKNKSVEEELAKIAAKQIELRSYGIENVISIDECPFYEEIHPNYGWSKRGTPVSFDKMIYEPNVTQYSVPCRAMDD